MTFDLLGLAYFSKHNDCFILTTIAAQEITLFPSLLF